MAAEGAKPMAKQANVITINIRRARPAQGGAMMYSPAVSVMQHFYRSRHQCLLHTFYGGF